MILFPKKTKISLFPIDIKPSPKNTKTPKKWRLKQAWCKYRTLEKRVPNRCHFEKAQIPHTRKKHTNPPYLLQPDTKKPPSRRLFNATSAHNKNSTWIAQFSHSQHFKKLSNPTYDHAKKLPHFPKPANFYYDLIKIIFFHLFSPDIKKPPFSGFIGCSEQGTACSCWYGKYFNFCIKGFTPPLRGKFF